jgi:hypothetical protein
VFFAQCASNERIQGRPCPSVCMTQLETQWIDFDIWYGHYTTGGYAKLVIFNFLQWLVPTWRMNERTCEQDQHKDRLL